MKELYRFNVGENREVEEKEVKELNGETITTSKKVIKKVPVEFMVKEPSRSEKEEAEIVRATFLSNFIRRGVMPEAVLSKIYSDMGGTENKQDKETLQLLTDKFVKKMEEYSKTLIEDKDNKELIDKISNELIDIKREISVFQSRQGSLYENTAEYKAKIKLVEYLLTLLTYWRKDEKSDFKPFFEGSNFDKKLEYLEKLELDNNEIYSKIKDVVLFIISAYIHTGGNIKKDELTELIKENIPNIDNL